MRVELREVSGPGIALYVDGKPVQGEARRYSVTLDGKPVKCIAADEEQGFIDIGSIRCRERKHGVVKIIDSRAVQSGGD